MIQQKHRTLLYRLAEWSLIEVESSEKVLERVKSVLSYLKDTYPRSLSTFVRHYELCLHKIYLKTHLQIEYTGKFSQKDFENTLKSTSSRIVYTENPQLMGGIKMQHGDWIWDQSVRGELNELMRKLKKL